MSVTEHPQHLRDFNWPFPLKHSWKIPTEHKTELTPTLLYHNNVSRYAISYRSLSTASSDDPNDPKDPNYKPVYVPGATGLPSLANIPSVADLAASFEAKKQEKLRLEAQKKEEERRVSITS